MHFNEPRHIVLYYTAVKFWPRRRYNNIIVIIIVIRETIELCFARRQIRLNNGPGVGGVNTTPEISNWFFEGPRNERVFARSVFLGETTINDALDADTDSYRRRLYYRRRIQDYYKSSANAMPNMIYIYIR